MPFFFFAFWSIFFFHFPLLMFSFFFSLFLLWSVLERHLTLYLKEYTHVTSSLSVHSLYSLLHFHYLSLFTLHHFFFLPIIQAFFPYLFFRLFYFTSLVLSTHPFLTSTNHPTTASLTAVITLLLITFFLCLCVR